MHKPFDQFGKSLAERFVELYARVDIECEVQHAAQSVDIVFEPDGRVPPQELGGWLGRIAVAGPGMIECFSRAPRMDEVEACIYKRDGLSMMRAQRARQDGRPRPERPRLWLLSAGRPREVMRAYEAEPLARWPVGFWTLRRGHGLYVVVLPELPRTPDTLVLRLLGRDTTLEQAVSECAHLPRSSPMMRRLKPVLLAFKPHILQDLPRNSDMNLREKVDAMYADWERKTAARGRKEGRKEGERAALVRLLERRFGALPEALSARVAGANQQAIERWLDRLFDATSLDDVFAG
jgi:hypothetical protein